MADTKADKPVTTDTAGAQTPSEDASKAADKAGKTTLFVGVACIVLLIAATAFAIVRDDQKPADKTAQSTSGKPAPSKPTTSAPGSVTPTGAAVAAGGAVPPSKQGRKPGKPGSQSPTTRPGAPSAPAKQGSSLTTLTAPPEKTIGMIVVPKGFKGGTYAIEFEPYGWGPSGPAGGRLIAKILKSSAQDAGAKSLDKDFANRNATLWCAPDLAKTIKLGGKYTGTMDVRPQGDVGVLFLVKAEPAK